MFRRLTSAAFTAGALATYLATVPAANYAVAHFPAAPVGFGVYAPAGVYFAGLALVLRDLARERAGRAAVLAAMAAGVALSYWLADHTLALAAAGAFALSETLDYSVYEWLRRRGLMLAVGVAAVVGLIADSLLFLGVAFHSLHYLPGQILGKAWMTLLALIVIQARRRAPKALAALRTRHDKRVLM